ncbi:MAG TPA: class I SAM-dependent methyltransferase [Candidatus Limnocylindria bacterium]|nr:class I SAM-dependent methyltransferase [Candidatus Limnocylindria bacterium]
MTDPGAEYRFLDRAADRIAEIDVALDRGEIDEASWHARVAEIIRPAYLAATTPQAQSGFSGDASAWEHARGIIANAIDRDGTFLDIGCANGLLIETLVRWCAAKGIAIEAYGLDIVPELAALARARLPRYADRIFVGNGLNWVGPTRFDFVRAGLEYVPGRRRGDFVAHLVRDVVADDGRLVIGVYNEDRDAVPTLESIVQGWGYRVTGRSARPHRTRVNELQRVFWVDGPARTMA